MVFQGPRNVIRSRRDRVSEAPMRDPEASEWCFGAPQRDPEVSGSCFRGPET